jgi:hypothetical protein
VSVAYYHFSVKRIGRSAAAITQGRVPANSRKRGVVASAAYRAAEKLTDRSTDVVYNFTFKRGVEDTFILNHKNVPAWAYNRSALWNAADQAAAKRSNARVATEFELALPKELNKQQRKELVTEFIQPLIDKYHIAADVSIHISQKTEQNIHAHILLTHRELGPSGFGDIANRRVIKKGEKELTIAGITRLPSDVDKLRKEWADHLNKTFKKLGIDIIADHRSYIRQDINIKPQLHVGREYKNNADLENQRQQRIQYNKNIIEKRAVREQQSLDQVHDQRHDTMPDDPKAVRQQATENSTGYTEPQEQVKPTPTPENSEPPPQHAQRERQVPQTGAHILTWERERELEQLSRLDQNRSDSAQEVVEDVARELSPQYAQAVKDHKQLDSELRKVQYRQAATERRILTAKYRQDERLKEMGGARRLLDRHKIKIDKELAYWKREETNGNISIEKLKITQKLIEDSLETVQEREQQAFNAIRREAQRVRLERIEAAIRARNELQDKREQRALYEQEIRRSAEIVDFRQHMQKRGHRP